MYVFEQCRAVSDKRYSEVVQLAENNTFTVQQPAKVNVWINTDSANAAALVTAIDVIWNAATYLVQEFDLLP